MPYDPSIHHRRSIRLKGYDYSQAGGYFITICAQYRECLFGDIVSGEMHLNRLGEIMVRWWDELPRYYAPVVLDEFVVMPNHIHGIIVLTENVGAGSSRPSPPPNGGSSDAGVGLPCPPSPSSGRDDPAPTKRTLGQLVGYYKFKATKEINQVRDAGYAKVLQRDYYEHIIRNEREWIAIAEYIRNNPANWLADFDNPNNVTKRPPPQTADDYWSDAGIK